MYAPRVSRRDRLPALHHSRCNKGKSDASEVPEPSDENVSKCPHVPETSARWRTERWGAAALPADGSACATAACTRRARRRRRARCSRPTPTATPAASVGSRPACVSRARGRAGGGGRLVAGHGGGELRLLDRAPDDDEHRVARAVRHVRLRNERRRRRARHLRGRHAAQPTRCDGVAANREVHTRRNEVPRATASAELGALRTKVEPVSAQPLVMMNFVAATTSP